MNTNNQTKLMPVYNSTIKSYETVIELDYVLNSEYLTEHLTNFFNSLDSKLDYIAIITKVETLESEIYSFCNKTIIDLKNNQEVLKYIDDVTDRFNTHFCNSNVYDVKLMNKINITHQIANKENHFNFHKKINRFNTSLLDKQIAEGIIDPYNIPFNNLYETWGDVESLTPSKYILTNLYFNDKIKTIEVSNIGNVKSQHNVLFITFIEGKEQITLIDRMQSDGYIKRNYSSSAGNLKLWYTFNPERHLPELLVNSNKLPKIYSKDKEGKDELHNRLRIIKKVNNYNDLENKIIDLQNQYPDSDIADFEIPKLKAITLDCETFLSPMTNKKGVECMEFKLSAICFFDGKRKFKYYCTDYINEREMLDACFDKVFTLYYSNFNIYIHNGARFDLILLINYLLNREDVKIENVLYKDTKFLQLHIVKKFLIRGKDGKDRVIDINYYVKDSYLLLMNSLANLGESFGVKTKKDLFPHKFPNKDNLSYIGGVPSYEYFDSSKVSISDYNLYKKRFKNNWNIKAETLYYCLKDCISLYEILSSFKSLIDSKFKVDMQHCPTITSLAFKIFKADYYNPKETPIPSLTKGIFDDLHKGYNGGHVDMYIPEGPKDNGTLMEVLKKYNSLSDKSPANVRKNFKTINHYDVNSLYPSQMEINKYPTDMYCEFIGNPKTNIQLTNMIENNVGFYKVKITAPNIAHPIIPIKVRGSSIYGYGEWTGWYFSEELKNAEKYGYTYDILGGYIFESKEIFKEYIEDLYKIKENSAKGGAMYLISKLLMNSLYGRFGMDIFLPSAKFMTDEDFEVSVSIGKIDPLEVEVKQYENHVLVITPNKSTDYSVLDGNIAIASSITSYSRIRMCDIKNNILYKLYYTDTDSGFMEGELSDDLVNPKKIGYWTHEKEYIYCAFLGPKTYACIDIYGNAYSKIKGYSSPISIEEVSNLLNIDIERKPLSQEKWIRVPTLSKIVIKTTPYDLVATANKRELIYENNRLTATANKLIKDNNIIDSNKDNKDNKDLKTPPL